MNWYPLRGIDGLKNANLDAAVNLVVTNGRARVGFYAPVAFEQSVARLIAGGKVISEENLRMKFADPAAHRIFRQLGIFLFYLTAQRKTPAKFLKEILSFDRVSSRIRPLEGSLWLAKLST